MQILCTVLSCTLCTVLSCTLVPLPVPPLCSLAPCSSTPRPHSRSGARNRQMSTFPGAVRSGLLGDRDNTGEIPAQLRQGGTAGPHRGRS